MNLNEPLKTIKNGVQDIVYKDKGSKFIGFVRRVETAQEALNFFDQLKKKHPGANHCCYGYRLGIKGEEMRASDDGEPTHSAGAPILGQIQSFGLTHTAVAIVRYFGGTKLGVGGLIKAYKTAAQLSLEACQFKEEVILVDAQLQFKYADIGLVMTWLKQGAFEIIDQTLDQLCVISFKLSKNMIPEALAFWQGHKEIKIIVLQDRRPETEV